jgi:hypothetical protein
MKPLAALALLMALAGCGGKTVTLKVEGLGRTHVSTASEAALAQCKSENETIVVMNHAIERYNREQEALPLAERHIRLIKATKLCLP